MQSLAEQGERGDEDAWRGLSSLRFRAGGAQAESLCHFLGDPQGDEGLASAAGHERGGAVVLVECGEDVVERFALVRERRRGAGKAMCQSSAGKVPTRVELWGQKKARLNEGVLAERGADAKHECLVFATFNSTSC